MQPAQEREFRCYLCGSEEYRVRPGRARDRKELVPLQCCNCGLVMLSSFLHITNSFYEESHMWDNPVCPQAMVQIQSTEDDHRRFNQFSSYIQGKSLLDFGCGSGGFLKLIEGISKRADGLEPDIRWKKVHTAAGLQVFPDLNEIQEQYDVITLFHVLEHLPDPLPVLHRLCHAMTKDGLMIIEVPSANDALLTIYQCAAFAEFTYWSCHLFLHTPTTLSLLMAKAGFETVEIRQFQRYPIANHLAWLAFGKPGGQHKWPGTESYDSDSNKNSLNRPALMQAYEEALAEMEMCDTIIGLFRPAQFCKETL